MRSFILLACVGVLAAVSLGAENSGSVDEVLRAGWNKPVDRREVLDALAQSKRSDVSRWQAGYVKSGKEWVPFESVPTDEKALETQREYEALRESHANTAEGHAALAEWCRRNAMPLQERVHLIAAANLADGRLRSDLMDRAGYRRIGGQWVPPEQAAEWQAELAKTQASLNAFGPRLTKAAELLSENGRRSKASETLLAKLADSSAVPAIEYMLCGRNEATARAAIQALARIDSY
jgi:hypothetical protein